jgi:hypothetical protein
MMKAGVIRVRRGPEREAFDALAAIYSPEEGSLVWEGELARPADGDERMLLMLAAAPFRVRFADQWPVDKTDVDDE